MKKGRLVDPLESHWWPSGVLFDFLISISKCLYIILSSVLAGLIVFKFIEPFTSFVHSSFFLFNTCIFRMNLTKGTEKLIFYKSYKKGNKISWMTRFYLFSVKLKPIKIILQGSRCFDVWFFLTKKKWNNILIQWKHKNVYLISLMLYFHFRVHKINTYF